ncbi:serine hydrolase domain-containing protein [Nocardia australiensis]|uniref:serine hydrolase domain-containing protein n=1 Tax=Nocardia australiensis TaxID=2887191 RepID=UPI001D1362C4|nr:serine hydrolase [Nocardia australiensis]
MRRHLKTFAGYAITAVVLSVGIAIPGAAHAEPAHCATTDGRKPQTATPAEVGLDAPALDQAMALASDPSRLNVQVFRNNCLIATGPRNEQTGGVAWNLWSGTKSVVSMVAGIAVDEGLLDLDKPIDAYLPAGLGDAAHRSITVRNLLTESSGLRVAVASEGITGLVQFDPNVVAQALAMPIEAPQGTNWRYSQRVVDLVVYVVQQAVGDDFQSYTQRKLFDPLGIPRTDYHWARDRSGNTYGHAHLVLPPDDFAKLGLLVANHGSWNGNTIISTEYLAQATRPSATNPCYGFLFVVNGPDCASEFPGLPSDAVRISGMMRQDSFIVPSLGLVVNWTGVTVPGSAPSFPHDVLRAITAAFRDPTQPDAGPYVPQSDVSLADPMISNPDATLGALGFGPWAYPGCDALACLGRPMAPPFGNWPPGCFIVGCLGPDPATPGIR